MKAKQYLQDNFQYMREHWNENPHINDEWIAETMETFAKKQNEELIKLLKEAKETLELIVKKSWDKEMPESVIDECRMTVTQINELCS